MDIPKDKTFPRDAAQCDGCGGHGCEHCADRGWVAADDVNARRCPCCKKPIRPDAIALYCSVHCAMADAVMLLGDDPAN